MKDDAEKAGELIEDDKAPVEEEEKEDTLDEKGKESKVCAANVLSLFFLFSLFSSECRKGDRFCGRKTDGC
jgi:hypothetical protein